MTFFQHVEKSSGVGHVRDDAQQYVVFDRLALDLGQALRKSDQRLLICYGVTTALSLGAIISAAGVSHLDILLERGFRPLPFFGEISLAAGLALLSLAIVVAYFAILAFEADNRARLRLLLEALEAFRSAGYVGAHRVRDILRPSMTWRDGPAWASVLLRSVCHAAPMIALLVMLVASLPIQDMRLIWVLRLCLIVTVVAFILGRRPADDVMNLWTSIGRLSGRALVTLGTIFFACAVLTVPDEPADRWMRQISPQVDQGRSVLLTRLLFEPGSEGKTPLLWRHLSLPNVDLSSVSPAPRTRITLVGRNLRHARFDGANLRGVDMTAADLRGASLRGADLEGALLHRTDFRTATMADANLSMVKINSANFSWSDMRGVRLLDARLACPTADICGLVRAKLEGAQQLPDGLDAAIAAGRRVVGIEAQR